MLAIVLLHVLGYENNDNGTTRDFQKSLILKSHSGNNAYRSATLSPVSEETQQQENIFEEDK